MSKYRVRDFFLNASPNYEDIWSQFENTYYLLDYKDDKEILEQLAKISNLQFSIGVNMNGKNLSNVIEWCESLMPMIRHFGKYNKCYEYSLSLYRKALIMNGQTQKIPEIDNEIIGVCSHIYDTNGRQYLEHLINIISDVDANSPQTSYETNSSIILWKEVWDKAKLNFPNSWIYARALIEIADYNYRNQQFGEALIQYLSIDSLYKVKRNEWISEVWYNHEYLSAEQSETAMDLMQKDLSKRIGCCYYQKGEITNAIKYDGNNPYYHYALGNFDALTFWCEKSYEKSIKGLKSIIKDPIIIRPGAYYEEEFDIVYTPALTTHIPYFAEKTHSAYLCEKAYDGTLATKGFRLLSGNRLRQYLRTTKDSTSKNYSTQIEKGILTYQSMIRAHNLESVEKYREIVLLQREFIAYLDSIGALDTFFPKWTDVRSVLKENEVAIEFIEFPLWNQNQSMYAALTLRKDSEYPKIIGLFEKNQLKQVSDTLYYQCKDMTDLVWKPLKSDLQGIKNIYFSPSGVLHKIGIEYLPGMENYNIYRLSSTRELVTKHEKRKGNNAVLYGGLKYDAKIDSTSTTKSLAFIDKVFKNRGDVKSMGLRGGKENLKHTKIEVDTIGEYLKDAQWTCLLDTAALGTEESFKSLSGKGISNLHIATHGFYYTLDEVANANYDFLQSDTYIITEEDKTLMRSGLLMSGANHILNGDSIPDNVEDGLLTAKEIADVDLRGLDLVVLSACQTGLGDISQGEGVFGLQRGFKKAGANTILMSLWEVDDKATQILMTKFYKNYLAGQSKRESLLSAQKYLREYDNGRYNDPKYWAAFIMLDGLE